MLAVALVVPAAGAHGSSGLARALKSADGQRSSHVPSDFRRHTGRYWTWYGPKGWIDSQGQYDLLITSPVGRDMVHIGVSAAPCYNDPNDYFDAYRAFLKRTGAFYPKPLKSSRYTEVGKVRHLSSDATPYAWVQKVQFEGKKKSGGRRSAARPTSITSTTGPPTAAYSNSRSALHWPTATTARSRRSARSRRRPPPRAVSRRAAHTACAPASFQSRIAGKSSTSRRFFAPVSIITRRSMPIPTPPVGGIPCSSAPRNDSSIGCVSTSPRRSSSA